MTSSRIVFFVTLVVTGLAGTSVLTQRAGSIDTIAPAAARPGEPVTITGRGFGAFNVRVTVGGVPAEVVAANGTRVTFHVPIGVPHGATTVTATNPGGQSGAIAFQILEGVLLAGTSSSPAIDATVDLRELGVDPSLIDHHVILTRLDVRLAPDATIGQINAALIQAGGGIVSMSRHQPMVTIAVPRQPSIEALQALASRLSDAPGILTALIGRTLQSQILPASSAALLEQHTLPTRFPAAWNVMSLAARDCETRRIPVLVPDGFIEPEPNSHVGFDIQVPHFDHSPLLAAGDDTHGYDVTTTLTALFDDKILTGANPLANCLSVHGIETHGVTISEVIDRIVDHLPNERFIVSLSQGFAIDCDIITLPSGDSSCTPNSITLGVPTPFDRAWHAAYWKLRTHARWNDFFAAASAGNNRDEVAGIRYPGLSDGRFNSFMTTAKEDDPFFDFMTDTFLWRGTLDPSLPDLTATAQEVARLTRAIAVDHLDTVEGAPNELIVGSTTPGVQFSDLHLSLFSGTNSDISAVGENVRVFAPGTAADGTSFSAPQVAGLASYLWLLSDDLRRNQPIETTRRDIVGNGRTIGRDFVIDAYATVLSLDGAQLPTPQSAPVRLALLDLDNNGHFDEADLQAFAAHLLDANGNPVAPSARDYSRYDLNGDGFTGGPRTELFDLDRVHSTQFGAAADPTEVTQTIEGVDVHFDESSLTDAQILCYYSYSGLYTGDPDGRAQRLTGLCGVSVTVTPTQATLSPGGTQQFSSTVRGSADPRVTWRTDAPGATITDAGLFTAGGTNGTFTVTAVSVADPTVSATAHVIITGPAPGHGSGNVFASASGEARFDPNCPDLPIESPDNVQAFSRSLHCAGQFTGKPPENLEFTASGDATTTFSETDVLGELTSASATGVYVATATALGNHDPNLPPSQVDNAVSEAAGSYKLGFTVSQTRTVRLTGTLTGNDSSTFLQFGCGNVAFDHQAGAGPVDRTFTLHAGEICAIEVESRARSRALPPPQIQSPSAGFQLHVTVH